MHICSDCRRPKSRTGLRCKPCSKLGPRNPHWTGGVTKHCRGYVVLTRPDHPNADSNGQIFEHRVIMEQVLGRLLDPVEVVHHKNGLKDDNRPENLELFDSQSEHMIFENEERIERRCLYYLWLTISAVITATNPS